MPNHWTYVDFNNNDDLQQGDILRPTVELREVFEEVHPHFLNDKYTAFLLTTQSCDLVIRNKSLPNNRYLNIAVIRPIESVIYKLLPLVCHEVIEGVYLRESKQNAHALLERVFNQNEQALGLYYLHKDNDAGITSPSVALLRVAVTLKIKHYNILKRARVGRLSNEFSNKLGWLIGNLYSRIGTQDWSDPKSRSKELRKMIDEIINENESDLTPLWIQESWLNAAKENGVEIQQLTKQSILSEINQYKPKPPKLVAIEHVRRIISDVDVIEEEKLDRILKRLENDELFSMVFKNIK